MDKERAQLIADVCASSWSDFYRRRFEGTESLSSGDIATYWPQLPLLTRDELAATPYYSRLFVDPREVTTIRASSGTTGRTLMLTPRTGAHPSLVPLLRELGVEPTGYLTFMNPHHIVNEGLESDGLQMPCIAGDLARFEESVRMAAALPSINALRGTSNPPEQMWPVIRETGFGERVRAIEMLGTYWNPPMVRRLQTLFPHAGILLTYGMAEAQGFLAIARIAPGADVARIVYEPQPGFFFELVTGENATSTPEADDEGELVITTLTPYSRGCPLIRYLTGDIVRAVRSHAPGVFEFEIRGRSGGDRLKLAAGMVWAEEVERVLSDVLGELFTGEYEFEARSESDGSRESGIVKLPRSALTNTDRGALAAHIAEKLRISPERTYADASTRTLLAPLEVQELPPREGAAALEKPQRLYRTDSHS